MGIKKEGVFKDSPPIHNRYIYRINPNIKGIIINPVKRYKKVIYHPIFDPQYNEVAL